MAIYPVYIAGIGTSQVDSVRSNEILHNLAISAGAKALLDAGITYDDVDHSTSCFLDRSLAIHKSSFDSFGRTGASVREVESLSGLLTASQTVKSGYANCSLMIGLDKVNLEETQGQVAAIAIVLVSHNFITSHPYLKDSSALICGSAVVSPVHSRTSRSDSAELATKKAIGKALQHASLALEAVHVISSSPQSMPNIKQSFSNLSIGNDRRVDPKALTSKGSTGLLGLCEIVWQLRGWARDRPLSKMKNCLQYTVGQDGTAHVVILSRADGSPAPDWEEVEHLRDGKERAGYNPALENKDICFEDWQAVKSRDEFVPESIGKQLNLRDRGGDRAALAKL